MGDTLVRAKRIAEQLGMPHGTANHYLRKQVLFKYIKLAGDNFCYKCGKEIISSDTLSIEHKEPWEGRDADLFWDLDNIAFSHVQCNRPHKYTERERDAHGNVWCPVCKQFKSLDSFSVNSLTRSGIRSECRECNTAAKRNWRERRKTSK